MIWRFFAPVARVPVLVLVLVPGRVLLKRPNAVGDCNVMAAAVVAVARRLVSYDAGVTGDGGDAALLAGGLLRPCDALN